MARPRLENPRNQRIVVRVTEGEHLRLKACAATAGVGASEYVRRLVAQDIGAEEVAVAQSPTVPPPPIAVGKKPLPPKNTPGLLWCPAPLCQYRSVGAGECPVHGQATERMAR